MARSSWDIIRDREDNERDFRLRVAFRSPENIKAGQLLLVAGLVAARDVAADQPLRYADIQEAKKE